MNEELKKIKGVSVYEQNEFEAAVLEANKEIAVCKDTKDNTEEPIETEKERNIRLGKITPFGTALKTKSEETNTDSAISRYLLNQQFLECRKKDSIKLSSVSSKTLKSATSESSRKLRTKDASLSKKVVEQGSSEDSGSEYEPSDESSEDGDAKSRKNRKRKKPGNTKVSSDNEESVSEYWDSSEDEVRCKKRSRKKYDDDGDASLFESRIRKYEKSLEIEKESSIISYHVLDENYKIPEDIWDRLYDYQKIGVQWLWELSEQHVGGILGDEMGLGKTTQVVAFLAGLHCSKLPIKHMNLRIGLGPVLLACPTTVMQQWVKEFHSWYPPIKVALLHDTGTYKGDKKTLIWEIYKYGGVLITSYEGIMNHDCLLKYTWNYVILDEGHKIRNPDSQITLTVKRFKTPNRLILSGSPMQNNLKELWSLFDFVNTGTLGTLPVFLTEFSIPITHGGYENASEEQVQVAYRCASILKDLISPFLLRREKSDVKSQIQLPKKNEQVLFCRLTDVQRNLYKKYINSMEVKKFIQNNTHVFVALINLRNICNHPDIYEASSNTMTMDNDEYGYWSKSGKMVVVETLLRIWKKQGHKVLLFTQSKKMLSILEMFVQSASYNYKKLDGTTSIRSRQNIIDTFNADANCFVMLLTTKVGGLGINLTGADRVVIYDPDWNPATDTQARERAWRIGQDKNVTIYRLITAGTIEEKMYHRQIFKQFLTNKVLANPKQRRLFKSNDLFELFTLTEVEENKTETIDIFSDSEINIEEIKRNKCANTTPDDDNKIVLSNEIVEKMKGMAKKLSKKISDEYASKSSDCVTENVNAPLSDTVQNETRYRCNSVEIGNILQNDVNKIDKDEYEVEPSSMERKKDDKSRKKELFDGQHVPHLVKNKKYKRSKIENTRNSKRSTNEDDYVLCKLFSKSGVQAALKHDKIMRSNVNDYVLIEREVKRKAHQALEALKKSRESCWNPGSGSLTWTGQNGSINVKGILEYRSKKKNDKFSSSNIVEVIQDRKGTKDATNEDHELLASLQRFLKSKGGTRTDREIRYHFEHGLSNKNIALFRALLKGLCTFNKANEKNTESWTIRDDFR